MVLRVAPANMGDKPRAELLGALATYVQRPLYRIISRPANAALAYTNRETIQT